MKKISAIFSRGFLPLGGGDISIIENLENLSRAGFNVELHSIDFRFSEKRFTFYLELLKIPFEKIKNTIIYALDTIKIKIYLKKTANESFLTLKKIIEINKPDLVFSYFIDDLIAELADFFPKIPFFFFVNRADFVRPEKIINPRLKNFLLKQKNYLVPSSFMQKLFFESWGCKPIILFDSVKKEKYLVPNNNERNFITMINSYPEKGIEIFLKIAMSLPEKNFLLVSFWESSSKTFAKITGVYGNIKYLEPTMNMAEIYAKTRIIIYPSLVEEAFGRVIIESFLNGIPVLASNTGAIPETMAGSGFMFPIKKKISESIPRQAFPEDWIRIIKKLDYPDFYQKKSTECLFAYQRFSEKQEKSFSSFCHLLNSLDKND